MTKGEASKPSGAGVAKPAGVPAAAERALAEAEARRGTAGKQGEERLKEVGGREGPEPTRHGDWEKGGVASDF